MPRIIVLDSVFFAGKLRPAGEGLTAPDGKELESALRHGLVRLLDEEPVPEPPPPELQAKPAPKIKSASPKKKGRK